MNTPLRRYERDCGLTRFPLLVGVGVIGVLGAVLYQIMFVGPRLQLARNVGYQVSNGKAVYLAMRAYAADEGHEGAFPTFRDPIAKTALFANSNEAFEALMPRYLDDKRTLFNQLSAWCGVMKRDDSQKHRLWPGENDWCYVRGLREDSPKDWPILASAFAPGTTHYVTDPKQPGGTWRGTRAIIIYANGNGRNIVTTKSGDTYFIPRADKPTANAFAKDGEWLAGEHVEVLYPLPPPAGK